MAGISVLVLSVSCEGEKPTPRTPEKQDQPKGVLYLERLLDTEAVMAELGNLAWVYKIRGDGELTTEYTIYYRPKGKNQIERVIFQAFGDTTILFLHDMMKAEEIKELEEGGYIIVTRPESFDGDGDVGHHFSLRGANSYKNTPFKELFPDTVRSANRLAGSASKPGPKTIKLSPGETKTIRHSLTNFNGTPDDVIAERERVRCELKVTGLKGGQLPERDE